jgi:hypothetical protein
VELKAPIQAINSTQYPNTNKQVFMKKVTIQSASLLRTLFIVVRPATGVGRALSLCAAIMALWIGSAQAQTNINQPPLITAIPDVIINVNTTTGPMPFMIGDIDGPLSALTVTASSANTVLVPNNTTSIALGTINPALRTITLTPALNETGQSVMTVSVFDALGAVSARSFLLTVIDHVNPVINCLADIVTSTDPGQCSVSGVVLGTPVATDSGGIASLIDTRSDGLPLTDPYPVGVTIVTWTATDNAGNSSTCQQTVTVNDAEPPQLSLIGLDPLVVACNDTSFSDPGAAATDNCPANLAVAVIGNVDVTTTGDYVVTYSAADAAGNSSSITRVFKVTCNNALLTILCPPDVVVGSDIGQCSAAVDYPAPVVTGNATSVICTPLAGSVFPAGTTAVTCTATDSAGNSAACSFNVTVNDTEPPSTSYITVKAFQTFQNPLRRVGTFQLFASDNCDPDPLIYISDSATGFVAGPFHNGDQVEIGKGPTLSNSQHAPSGGPNSAVIFLEGGARMYSVDSAGNVSPITKVL